MGSVHGFSSFYPSSMGRTRENLKKYCCTEIMRNEIVWIVVQYGKVLNMVSSSFAQCCFNIENPDSNIVYVEQILYRFGDALPEYSKRELHEISIKYLTKVRAAVCFVHCSEKNIKSASAGYVLFCKCTCLTFLLFHNFVSKLPVIKAIYVQWYWQNETSTSMASVERIYTVQIKSTMNSNVSDFQSFS